MVRLNDNYNMDEWSHVTEESVMSNVSGGIGDGQNVAHHVSEVLYFTDGGGANLYSNVGLSGQETVDFSLVARLIQNWMGPAITGAMLLTSGTMIGQVTGMSMRSMSPSLMELQLCIGLIGTEVSIQSPIFQASKINRRNFYTTLLPEDITKRLKPVDPKNQLDHIEKGIFQNAIPSTLLALHLFKIALEKYDEDSVNTKMQIFEGCFNVVRMLAMPHVKGGGTYVRSYMWQMCSFMLGIYNCNHGQGGQGSTLVYYQDYITEYDYNIHNAFFKYRLPQKNKAFSSVGNMNSFVTYFSRMLFNFNYSTFNTYVEIATSQRRSAYSINNTEDRVIFDKFIFGTEGTYESEQESHLNQISFDTIVYMIDNLDAEIPNLDLADKQDALLDYVDKYVTGYTDIMDIYKGKKCVFGETIMDTNVVNNFWQEMPDYPEEFHINEAVIPSAIYSHKKVLSLKEDTAIAKEQKKLYLTSMGNYVNFGYLNVGQYKYNYNAITFDIYVKVRGQEQLIRNADAITDTILEANHNTIKPNIFNLGQLVRIFDGTIDEGTPEEQVADNELIEQMKPLIDFTQEIGKNVEAMSIRSIYKKDITDHTMN